jgi:Ca-activated chloride channel family protein
MEETAMRIAAPQMFWLLLILVAPLTGFFWWAWRRRQQLITRFISSQLLERLKVGVSPGRQKARMALIVIAVVFVIISLARPQWGIIREEARQRGLDIIVAIDTSNSMLAEDVGTNRLTRAKLAALDLMRRAKTDRLGLVAFAGAAFLECPLTLDDGAFSQSVNALDTKTISQGGTAIGEAITEADKAFKNESDNYKVLVLFTDGEDHDSDAVAAAEKAAKEGMIIFPIGIGSAEGDTLRVRDDHGRIETIKDEDGKPVVSRLNENLLKDIASATKGFYLPLRGTTTMDTLYDRGLAPLPKSDKAVKSFQHYNERFQLPLGISVALLIVEMFLPDRSRRRSQRAAARAAAAPNVLAETTVILLLIMLPIGALGSPGSALREYNDGKYEDALKDYDQLLERKKDDPRLQFNAGDAAYQSRQLDAASNDFSAALASPDLQLQQRAYYNLGNTLYRLGEQLPDAGKKQAAWENAIKNYESALKLNQQDADAKFNQAFVKRQLEELKKQQQQSQSQNGQGKDQNKQDQQNQDQKNQQGKDQQNQQKDSSQAQQNQDKGNQSKDSQSDNKAQQKSDQQKQQEEQQRQQAEASQQKDDKNQQTAQNQAAGDQKDQSAEEAKREAAMMAAGQMTPQQAKQLLDSQKDEDRVFQIAPPNKETNQSRPYKNW